MIEPKIFSPFPRVKETSAGLPAPLPEAALNSFTAGADTHNEAARPILPRS